VIVGFPGETEEEFDITEKYLEKVHFYEMHVFKYSRRAGTKAAAMPDQIPEQIKGVRSDRLLALEQKMSEEFRKGFIGEKVSVLFEEMITVDGKEYLVGHTPEYVKAALPKEECEKMHAASGVILEAEAKDLLTSDILLLKNTIAE
jgi:threonylcarbamoyladenosine tRNA methylthiotransferase MtaB